MSIRKTRSPPHTSTVLSVWLRPLADYLDSNGFNSREIFEQGGVDVNNIFLPSARIPLVRAARLWQTAAQLTHRPFIGLEIFDYAPTLQADTVAVAMMASRNLYEALQRLARLVHVICDGVDIAIERKHDQIRLNMIVRPQDKDIMPMEAMDPAVLMIINAIKQGLAGPGAIRQLGFGRPYPGEELARHVQDLYGIPTQFDCDHHNLLIDWQQALSPNPYWNPSLAQMSEELALKDLQQLQEDNIVGRARKLILEQLPNGTPQQDTIAAAMNLSPRQLQRRLGTQGINFGELLQQVRLTLAHDYLRDPVMAMVDIGLELGFQDQSNFVKAFKKWTGETPGLYRKRVLAQ